MKPRLSVVARRASVVNRFEQHSLQQAINTKDFLKEVGEYDEVSIFQQVSREGPRTEWVKLAEPEC